MNTSDPISFNTTDLRPFLEELARGAGAIAMKYFQSQDLEIISKSDASPVTRADRESELYLREHIRARFPSDFILGEEFGIDGVDSRRRWILDPIDGTKSFVHGVPLFGVLIALEEHGEVTHGCAYFPALDEIVSARKGYGCWWNGTECHVSSQTELSRSLMLTTSPARLEQTIGTEKYATLIRDFGIFRGWGDCYGHALVATGRAEAMLDPIMKVWDAAPLGLLVEEAGGASFDFSGNPGIEGGSLVSCNGHCAGYIRSIVTTS